MPDLEAKLAGLQKPRGWGLFLIENMVDELRVSDADGRHTVELVLNLEGGGDGWRPLSSRLASATRDGTVVIELTGDVDREAEAQLDAAYAQVERGRVGGARLRPASTYINSTGIAVIVGLLAQARTNRQTLSAGA